MRVYGVSVRDSPISSNDLGLFGTLAAKSRVRADIGDMKKHKRTLVQPQVGPPVYRNDHRGGRRTVPERRRRRRKKETEAVIRWGVGGCREHHRRRMTRWRRRIKVRTILPRGISPLLADPWRANMAGTVRERNWKGSSSVRIFFLTAVCEGCISKSVSIYLIVNASDYREVAMAIKKKNRPTFVDAEI